MGRTYQMMPILWLRKHASIVMRSDDKLPVVKIHGSTQTSRLSRYSLTTLVS
jgi:hypothetical protein